MLIRQTLLYLPAQFLSPAAQFASMLVWTWWLQPGDMGAFALITATQELAYLVSLSWFSAYALRFMAGSGNKEARARYLGTETTLVLLSLIPQLLVAFGTAVFVDALDADWVTVLVITAFFVTRSANSHFADRARAETAIGAYTVLQVAGPLGGLALGLVAATMTTPDAITLIGAYAVAQALGNLIALPMIGVALRPRRPDPEVLKAAIAYGGPMLGLFALAWIADNHFRYVMEHAAGTATLGLIAVGWGLGRRCASFAAMLVTAAAFPLAARLLNDGDRQGALRQLGLNAAMLSAVLFPSVAGLALIADPMVELLVAEPYRETTRAVLGMSILAGAIHFLHVHVTDQLLVLEQRFVKAAAVDIVETIAGAVFTLAGFALWGVTGAVGGSALGSLVAFILSAVFACGGLGFRFPLADLARITLATGLMALALAALPVPPTALGLATAIAVGGLAYSLALAVLYAREIAGLLRRRLQPAAA